MAELLVYATEYGTFLEFRTSAGKNAMVDLDAFADGLPAVAQEALHDWCEEARDDPDIDHELVSPVFEEDPPIRR
jgi:hypothetical protein